MMRFDPPMRFDAAMSNPARRDTVASELATLRASNARLRALEENKRVDDLVRQREAERGAGGPTEDGEGPIEAAYKRNSARGARAAYATGPTPSADAPAHEDGEDENERARARMVARHVSAWR
jgi:hypothetical protein